MRARGNVNDAANSRAVSSERSGLERTLGLSWVVGDRRRRVDYFVCGAGRPSSCERMDEVVPQRLFPLCNAGLLLS